MASSCHQASGEPCEKTQDLNNWLDKDSVAKFLTPSTDLLAAFPLHAASWRQGTKSLYSLYSPPLSQLPSFSILHTEGWGEGEWRRLLSGGSDGQSYLACGLKTPWWLQGPLPSRKQPYRTGQFYQVILFLERKCKFYLRPVY